MADSASKLARPRLTVAMIVRDEQEVLAATIESIRPIADEILVLDTGSTDQTPSLAERLGARVIASLWTDDFSVARNRCWREATGDYVLWLDAGERLDAESAAELRRFVDQEAAPDKVYAVWVEVPPRSRESSPEQVVQLRLTPNRPDLLFEGRVRETLQPSIDATGLRVAAAAGRILCHPREQRPERRQARASRNLRLAELDVAEADNAKRARLCLVRGDAHGELGEKDDARRAYSEALEAAETDSTEALEAYYGLLTTYDDSPTAHDAAMRVCLEALEAFPLDAQLLLAMGNLLQKQGRMDLAIRSFEAAVEHGQVDLEVWHLKDLAEVAVDYLNLSLQLNGEDDRARGVLERAVEQHPNSPRIRRRLVDLHVKHARRHEALTLIGPLAEEPSGIEPLANAVRGACKAAGKKWNEAISHLQDAFSAGCRDPLCLRWLSVSLLATGRIEPARPVVVEWHRVEPTNAEAQGYLSAMGLPPDAAPSPPTPPSRQFRLDPAGKPTAEVSRPQASEVERDAIDTGR